MPAGSAAVVAALYLVEILTRYVGDGQTRWGTWRSMTEGVLAAARVAARSLPAESRGVRTWWG